MYMKIKNKCLFWIIPFVYLGLHSSCNHQEKSAKLEKEKNPKVKLFALLSPDSTNVYFENHLQENMNVNVLMYEYLYNGGGVAAGDFNDDNKIDLYFTSNLEENKLYLNQGNFKFKDVTKESNTSGRKGPWKTGVTSVDVNGDGKLDIYVCYSGALPEAKRKNQLFINQGNKNGIPYFEDESEKYGLASAAFSNQAHFFDYDHDGDLDALLLNHNPKSLPVLNEITTAKTLKIADSLRGLRLYQQNNGIFKDITEDSGISGSSLSYGLGLCISDVNNDGWVDFYVSNDYTIPDYLYINNKDGTFSDKIAESMGHISHFSMGNNIVDINNDGWQDIFTLDMLPEDNQRQKLLLAPDNYEKFDLNIRSGFHSQYMRNMLQLNNGNGTFSEIGQFAGISNTDWSWAPLFADFNNDGWKDLFVSNGYFRDYTNLDFINYMENYVQSKGRLKREDVLEIIKKMPSSDIHNYMFINNKGISFRDKTLDFGMDEASNSNGAAYADLDNDGDLDLIVNNINKPAFIYENKSPLSNSSYLKIKLEGVDKNTSGIGSKVVLYNNGKQQNVEQISTRGYLSTVSNILHFGLGNIKVVDSLHVLWNTGKQQSLYQVNTNQLLTLKESEASIIKYKKNSVATVFNEIKSPISHKNISLEINDFKRQPLLLSEFSHQGTIVKKEDVNSDGREDVFVGGEKGQASKIYLQTAGNKFSKIHIEDFEKDKEFIDSDVVFLDANLDGNQDIYIASGGYHDYEENSELLQDRLYYGDGKGSFAKVNNTIPNVRGSKGCIASNDINQDGYMDLFIGGRVVPGRYPEAPQSFFLLNDGKGNFINKTNSISKEVKHLGMITDATWVDINGDSVEDLILVGEWMPIKIFINENGKLVDKTDDYFKKEYKGWWNTIAVNDFNKDGKLDFMIGNIGNNSQFKVSHKEPAEMYYGDYDKNGAVDPLFCYYVQGKSYPYLTRGELLGQLGSLRSKFSSYESYSQATIKDVLSAEQLKASNKLEMNHDVTSLFLSNPDGSYELASLPKESQFSNINTIQTIDVNSDGNDDVLLFGNNNHYKLRLGKSDANYGVLLMGDGKGNFEYINQIKSGFNVKGEVSSSIMINNLLFLGLQNDELKAYKLN